MTAAETRTLRSAMDLLGAVIGAGGFDPEAAVEIVNDWSEALDDDDPAGLVGLVMMAGLHRLHLHKTGSCGLHLVHPEADFAYGWPQGPLPEENGIRAMIRQAFDTLLDGQCPEGPADQPAQAVLQ